ncbi:MAG: hypothetical protein ACNI3H_07790 [Halarcobacter ebronensis]
MLQITETTQQITTKSVLTAKSQVNDDVTAVTRFIVSSLTDAGGFLLV